MYFVASAGVKFVYLPVFYTDVCAFAAAGAAAGFFARPRTGE
jgi:hypothetical protein